MILINTFNILSYYVALLLSIDQDIEVLHQLLPPSNIVLILTCSTVVPYTQTVPSYCRHQQHLQNQFKIIFVKVS